jgi:hypothetical protein
MQTVFASRNIEGALTYSYSSTRLDSGDTSYRLQIRGSRWSCVSAGPNRETKRRSRLFIRQSTQRWDSSAENREERTTSRNAHVPLGSNLSVRVEGLLGETDTRIPCTCDTRAHKARRFGAFERPRISSLAPRISRRANNVVRVAESSHHAKECQPGTAEGQRVAKLSPARALECRRDESSRSRVKREYRRGISCRIPGGSADLTATFSYPIGFSFPVPPAFLRL